LANEASRFCKLAAKYKSAIPPCIASDEASIYERRVSAQLGMLDQIPAHGHNRPPEWASIGVATALTHSALTCCFIYWMCFVNQEIT
jgi:hypothetical protein